MAGLDPSGARGRRGARRHPDQLRRARVRAGHRGAAARLVDRALADVEGAGAAPGPPPPRGHLRRARQRWVGPPGGCGRLRQRRVRRRHRRGHGCRRRRAGGARGPLERCRVGGPGGRRAPRPGAGAGRDRAGVRLVAAARARPSSRPTPTRRTTPRAGRSTTATTGSTAATTTSSSSSSPRCSTSRTRPASARRASTWAHEVAPQTLVDCTSGRLGLDGAETTELGPLLDAVRCPVLVLHGSEDRVRAVDDGVRFAERSGGSLVVLDGAGHGPPMRDPVVVNRELDRFVERVAGAPGIREDDPAALVAGAAPAARGARALVADRPGPHPARPGDRRGAARRAPRRAGAVAGPGPGDSRAGGGRRGGAPGVARGWRRSRRTSRPSAASTTSTRSTRSGGWTTSWSTTSWCSTRCSRPSTSTSSSGTRRGRPTTSCTRTPS